MLSEKDKSASLFSPQVLTHLFVLRPFLKLFFGINVAGWRNLASLDQYIVIANHNSHLDTLLLFYILPIKKILTTQAVAAEEYFSKWSVIGHFYGYSYYVYVYSTSFLASVTLADQILAEEEGAIERFMDMISAGGSDYPVNLLQKAGVDLTTSDPFEYAMKSMHRLMDEVEAILDSKEK